MKPLAYLPLLVLLSGCAAMKTPLADAEYDKYAKMFAVTQACGADGHLSPEQEAMMVSRVYQYLSPREYTREKLDTHFQPIRLKAHFHFREHPEQAKEICQQYWRDYQVGIVKDRQAQLAAQQAQQEWQAALEGLSQSMQSFNASAAQTARQYSQPIVTPPAFVPAPGPRTSTQLINTPNGLIQRRCTETSSGVDVCY